MTNWELLGLFFLAGVVSSVAAALIPASRGMRSELVLRAQTGTGALAYASQLVSRERLSILEYISALRSIEGLIASDRQAQLLSMVDPIKSTSATKPDGAVYDSKVLPFKK